MRSVKCHEDATGLLRLFYFNKENCIKNQSGYSRLWVAPASSDPKHRVVEKYASGSAGAYVDEECTRRNIGLIAVTHDTALAQKICNDCITADAFKNTGR
jgi:hypothetical protein